MVSPEDLACLDVLIWLGSGSAAAKVCKLNQSNISRRSRHVCELFGVQLGRHSGEYRLAGDGLRLLSLQREVHQLHRLLGGAPLRLDGSLLLAPLLRGLPANGWQKGPYERISSPFTAGLLQDRIVDAWVGPIGDDSPVAGNGEVHIFDLFETALCLLVDPGHPLAGKQNLSAADLEPFPRHAPMRQHYQTIDRQLASMAFRTKPLEQSASKYSAFLARRNPPTPKSIFYGTRLANLGFTDRVVLDITLPVSLRIGLHVLRPLSDHPSVEALRQLLLLQAQRLSSQFPELELSFMGNGGTDR